MTNYRKLYSSCKNDTPLTGVELRAVKDALNLPIEDWDYHAILLNGLAFDKDEGVESIIKAAIPALREAEEDDLIKACLTAICIYWNDAKYLENELEDITLRWDFDLFPDSFIVASSAYARLAYKERSRLMVDTLKIRAVELMAQMDERRDIVILVETITKACITAVMGPAYWTSAEIRKYMNPDSISTLEFR
ncbi:hypothetical protein [Sphingorhabdus sp.]|uniref:hypothetical protein n=1 Tax=Sphingorhabdus sp. TaxID=1902408 RepID=UPI003594663A